MSRSRALTVETKPSAPLNRPAPAGGFFDVVKQFPLKLAVSVAGVAGWTLLHLYLASIDYVPRDLLALIGYAGIASAWLLVFWLGATLVMFLPAAATRGYEIDKPPIAALFTGQASGALLTAALVWPDTSFRLGLSIAAFAFGAVTVWVFAKESPRRDLWSIFQACYAPVGGAVAVVWGVLVLVQSAGVGQPRFDAAWRLGVGGVVLLLIFGINVWAATKRTHMTIVGGVCAAAVAALFVAMTTWWYVPSVIAVQIGLKLPGVVTLSIPRATCERLMAATERLVAHSEAGPVPQCTDSANFVSAEVQLRWSGQWLLSLRTINGLQIPDTAPRVVVPDDGTFLLLPASTAPR